MRALLCLALVGCAYEDVRPVAHAEEITASVSYTIHGDTMCPAEVREADAYAQQAWGTVSQGHIELRTVWDLTPATILEYAEAPILVCRSASWSTEYCGMTTGDIVEISLAPGCDRRSTVLHELGHLAGIRFHIPTRGAVMHQSDVAHFLTAADVDACANVGLCPRRSRTATTVTVQIDPAIPRVEPEYPDAAR